MKTAEQILEKHYTNHKKRIGYEKQVYDAMKEYASQAVDRCAEKAEWKTVEPRMTNMDGIEVDKDSILKVKSELK